MTKIKLSIIVAATNNNVIGNGGKMPWHLPRDLAYFKKTTLKHPVIMGRKTYESIGFVLPDRDNIVISRDPDFKLADATVISDLDSAIHHAKQIARQKEKRQVFVIGGANLFGQVIAFADCLYLNRILADVLGDTFLPEIDLNDWHEVSREHHLADAKNNYDIDFLVYHRK